MITVVVRRESQASISSIVIREPHYNFTSVFPSAVPAHTTVSHPSTANKSIQ